MQRSALVAAVGSLIAAALPSPGLYVALALGIVAVGLGWIGFGRRSSPGSARLASASAIALGAMGTVLGTARLALVVLAIGRIDAMLG